MCQITILDVRGVANATTGRVESVIVSGTADQCANVVVVLEQDFGTIQATTPPKTAPVEIDQTWQAEFSVAAGDFPTRTFRCGDQNKYSVRVACEADPTCQDSFSGELLPCGNCPLIGQPVVNVGPCNSATGLRAVTLTVSVTPAPNAPATVVQWFSDSDVGAEAHPVTQAQQNASSTIGFPQGQHTAELRVILPEGCVGIVTDPFTVDKCVQISLPPPPEVPPPLVTPGTPVDVPPIVPPPPPPESGGCAAARLIGLALIFIGLALVVGGSCSGNPVITGIGIGIFALGALFLILWAIFCPSIDRCFLVNRIIQLLGILTVILAVVAVIFHFLKFAPGCVAGLFIGSGLVGSLLAIMQFISVAIGCTILVGLSARRAGRIGRRRAG